MNKHRKNLLSILIWLTVGFLFWYATHPYVKINIKDNATKQYVDNPGIVSSELTMIAGPGTGGGGPLLYSLSSPRLITVTSNTYGYKEKTVRLYLIPGLNYTIWINK